MTAATSTTDLASLIVAIGTAVAAIIAAIYGAKASKNTTTPPGAPTLGETVTNTAAAVTTPPHAAPLGQVLADVADTVDAVKDAVNGKT